MAYFTCESAVPLTHIESGMLISSGGFQHINRKLDYYVLLLGREGTLYLTSENIQYEIKPHTYLLLQPGQEHFGYQVSQGPLSYYWIHFNTSRNQVKITNDYYPGKSGYCFPKWGIFPSSPRLDLLLHQLLDISSQKRSPNGDYAVSLLQLELSWAYQNASNFHCGSPQRQVFEISEWIRLHIHEPQTVSRIAMEFNYHPNYLSTLFKRVTGDTLLHYINRQKVSYSEELLLNTVLPIKQIALSSGFEDEKHFMKLFKQYKGVTPSQYRNSFCQVHLNHK